MSDEFGFFLLLMSNGILIGLMYALIALGFVLVYKATDAVNFAQGEFVMIAGFVAASALVVWGAPLWVAVLLALAGLVVFGFALERVMLRRLIGRPVIAVVMATIGLASILRGVGPFVIFSGTKPLPLPLREEPFIRYNRALGGGKQADAYLRKVGIVPHERFQLSSLPAIAMLVDRGLGVSLAPDASVPWLRGLRIARLSLPDQLYRRRLGVIWPRASVRTRLIQALVQAARKAVARRLDAQP